MKLGTMIWISFLLGFLFSILAAYMKITHLQGANNFLVIGVIASLVFIITAIYEVQSSKQFNQREKIMWTIALILMSGVAGLVYFLVGRRRLGNQ